MSAVEYQIYQAVVTAIQGLSPALTNISNGEIVLRKIARDEYRISRGITVSPLNTTEGPGVNQLDDFGYGMLIYFVSGTAKGYLENIDTMTLWRARVRLLFHNKRISVIALNYVCKVSPGDAYITKEQRENQDVSALLLRVWTREPRTDVT